MSKIVFFIIKFFENRLIRRILQAFFALEMMIAKATVEVLDRLQGVRTTALTHHQVANLRAKLPSPEWSRLREKFDEVQVLAYGYSLVMSDPSFRSGDASIAEEPEVPSTPEVSGE